MGSCKAKLLSVVIPTFNRCDLLKQALESFLSQREFLHKVIVIDDGSDDATALVVKNFKDKCGFIEYYYQDNRGYQAALNYGLGIVKSDLIAIIDDDSIVSPNWAEEAVRNMKKYPLVAAIGGPIININESSLAKAFHVINFSKWEVMTDVQYVDDLPTCNVVYRKRFIYNQEFIVDYPNLGYRDSLFNFALRKNNYRLLFIPDLSILHLTHGSYLNFNNFRESLRKKANGFSKGGYKCHGFSGYLVRFCPFFYFAVLVFYFMRYKNNLRYLFGLLPLIIFGQWIFVLELLSCFFIMRKRRRIEYICIN